MYNDDFVLPGGTYLGIRHCSKVMFSPLIDHEMIFQYAIAVVEINNT